MCLAPACEMFDLGSPQEPHPRSIDRGCPAKAPTTRRVFGDIRARSRCGLGI